MSMSDPRSPWEVLRRHADKLIRLGLVISFALGCWGYSCFLPAQSKDWSVLDVIYNTLQLFILEVARDANEPEDWNWMIHVARFTAPAFLAGSAFQVFLVNIKSWKHSRHQSALKDHDVVIGAGRTAVHLTRSLLETPNQHGQTGRKVVHLHGKGETPLVELAEEPRFFKKSRFFPIPGDPTVEGVLKKARVDSVGHSGADRAGRIIIAAGNDHENLKIGEALRKCLGDSNEGRVSCFLEMSPDPGSPLHREEAANHLSTTRLAPQLFQPHRIWARELIGQYPPHGWGKGDDRLPGVDEVQPMHVLVVGFEPFGKEVVKQIIRVCHYLDRAKVRITIVAENAEREYKRFEK